MYVATTRGGVRHHDRRGSGALSLVVPRFRLSGLGAEEAPHGVTRSVLSGVARPYPPPRRSGAGPKDESLSSSPFTLFPVTCGSRSRRRRRPWRAQGSRAMLSGTPKQGVSRDVDSVSTRLEERPPTAADPSRTPFSQCRGVSFRRSVPVYVGSVTPLSSRVRWPGTLGPVQWS